MPQFVGFYGLIKYMISKIFRVVALTIIVGFPLHSLASDDCERGHLCNIFEKILSDKGGPFAGVTAGGSSLSNLQFQQKALCELPGAKCTDELRLGCSRITNSVISGVIECWGANDKNFKLVDRSTGENVTYRSYDVVANLENNNTDYKLIVAKRSYYDGSVLLNENGQVLADGSALGCDSFQAAGEGTVACVRGDKKYLMKVENLEKARRASVNVREVADKFAVNLCSIALNNIASERRSSNFIRRIFMGKSKTFEGIAEKPIEIVTNDQGYNEVSPSCSISPDSERCTSIYLTAKGLECYGFGTLKSVKPLKVSQTDLVNAAKKYVFKDREVVKMEEIYKMADDSPSYIKITRPDHLLGSTTFITSASRSGSGGYRRGTN